MQVYDNLFDADLNSISSARLREALMLFSGLNLPGNLAYEYPLVYCMARVNPEPDIFFLTGLRQSI